jgi:hypothetical protein
MLYRQSIALFGILLPLIIACAVVGGVLVLKGNIADSFVGKQSNYSASDKNRINVLGIEAKVSRKKQFTDQWKTQLSKETKSTVNDNLSEIQKALPSKEFQPTAFDPIGTPGGIGSISAQRSSQIRLGFRGTFRTMQRAFLTLESQMPQLQLQDLTIEPSSTQTALDNFDVNYTSWEN